MKIHRYLLPLASLLLADACSSPGNINGQNAVVPDADATKPTLNINLNAGDGGVGYTTEGCTPIPCAPCPNGKPGTRFCPAKHDAGAVPQKIFSMAPRRFYGEWYPVEDRNDPTGETICLCESVPDAGTETAPPPSQTPDAGIDVQAPADAYVPPADAKVTMADAFVPPPVTVPDAAIDTPPAQTCFPPNRVMTDEDGNPVRWCGEGTIVVCREVWKCEDDPNPKPDASVPVTQPDAFVPLTVTLPDAGIAPDTRPVLAPDTAPPVVMTPDARPDLRPDLQPDLLPDAGLDTTPDAQIPLDTYVAPDLAPNPNPDTKPDCGCVEKRDTAPACWYGTPWNKDITLTPQECGGIEVKWHPEDCSTYGYKIVWIKNTSDDETKVEIPTYSPRHLDGFEYVSDGSTTSYVVQNPGPGRWSYAVYKYPAGNPGTGQHSNTAVIIVP